MRPSLLVCLLLAAQCATGATFTVNNTQDSGPGSLRQAILDANALAGADTLDCQSISGTITLLGALPALSTDMNIVGPGPAQLTVTRDGNVFTRIFSVSATVSITGLRIFGGWVDVPDGGTGMGAGILSSGNLTLTGVKIEDCYVQGFAGIGSGAGFAAGGGIAATAGSLTLTDCFIEDCRAQAANNAFSSASGGGIYSVGVTHSFLRVEIELCEARNYPSSPVLSVNGCACELSGGGTLNDFYADTCANSPGNMGAVVMLHENFILDRFSVFLSGSSCLGLDASVSGAVLRNGTIRGAAQCTHAIFCTGTAAPSFSYCTIYDNYQSAEALFASGNSPSLRSCIVAANGVGDDVAGSFIDLGFNLIGKVGAATGFSTSTLVGTAASPIAPLLSPLIVVRRGKKSYCFIPMPGSPAIDAGGAVSGVTLDQDNLPRMIDHATVPDAPGSDGSDIGAIEADAIIISVSRPPNPPIAQGGADALTINVPTQQPITLTYEITNTGNQSADLPANAIALSAFVNCTASVVTQPGAGTLAPAGLALATLVVTPLVPGGYSVHVALDSRADFTPFTWDIGGNADGASLSVTRVTSIPVSGTDLIAGGATGAFDLTYTLTNTGLGALFFMGAAPVYCDSTVNCAATPVSAPASINPGASGTVVIHVTPTAPGLFSAKVHLLTNDPLNPDFAFILAGASVPAQSRSSDDAACSSSEQSMPAIALLAFLLFATLRLRSRAR